MEKTCKNELEVLRDTAISSLAAYSNFLGAAIQNMGAAPSEACGDELLNRRNDLVRDKNFTDACLNFFNSTECIQTRGVETDGSHTTWPTK